MESLALHTDLYQINMAYAYFNDNKHEKKAVFEAYFRKNPFNNGYAVFAGVERIVDYINRFKFTEEDIEYLRELKIYSEDFLAYLKNMKFTGNIRVCQEGEIVFANEPLLIVEANLIEAQLLETAILNIINFQTLIATKASRIRNLAKTEGLFEFGARRAQELDAALWGARATIIGGFDGTSLVIAGEKFGLKIVGTHSHSFVQVYQDEKVAFKKYAESHKDCTFLVDTYDTLKSGLPNAIEVAKTFDPNKNVFSAIRIDSGDLAYQSKEARKILDEAGFKNTKITVSNDLDEDTIASLLLEGSKIDNYGIGTKLITAYSQPALGAVYKLVAVEEDQGMVDVIKISGSIEKITTPGKKKVFRVINKLSNKSEGDYIILANEKVDEKKPLIMFEQSNPLIYKTIHNYCLKDIHIDLYIDGKINYELPHINEIKDYCYKSLDLLWDEHKRYRNPARYYVDLSQKCYENKQRLISKYGNKKEK
ncbi:nicotinate phosphoribosyltransferase [Mycoplasma sp. P36-A1]|uniref:nicotinate phosphoribosyltransferase n=1 Tax=Mycoplasma sp. P36-A1 TaxID=3252900 RepID=UPI003C30833C